MAIDRVMYSNYSRLNTMCFVLSSVSCMKMEEGDVNKTFHLKAIMDKQT